MKNIYLKVTLISFVLVFCTNLKSENYTDGYSIIVGTPYRIKDSPNELITDRVEISALYVVYFSEYKVIAGDHEKRRILKVEIQASSASIIPQFPEIYVVVKESDEKVLDGGARWGKPMYSVCLPVDDVEEYGLGDEFGTFVFNTGERCRGAYGDKSEN